MSVKELTCYQCASPINFGGKSSVICQICGYTNQEKVSKKAINDAIANMEEMLGAKIEDLEKRFKSTGADIEARDYIYRKDFKPRIDVVFENLKERFDEHFRKPIYQINLLSRYSPSHKVQDLFVTRTSADYSEHFTQELNKFAGIQLEQPIMHILAASVESKEYIQLLKRHSIFLSRLYNIRGLALNLNATSIKAVGKLINLALEDSKILEKEYEKFADNELNNVKFEAWTHRLEFNANINTLLEFFVNREYQKIITNSDKLITEADKIIQDYTKKSEEDKETYPLFLVMVIIEAFNVDKKIIQILRKLVDVITVGNLQMDFFALMNQLEMYLNAADTAFNQVDIKSAEWDKNWIKGLQDPFERLFEILNNFIFYLKIIAKKEKVFLLDIDKNLFNPWLSNNTVVGSQLSSEHFTLNSIYNIRSKIQLLIPVAATYVYAILKTGFIRKAGDEFESFLVVNPYFRNDPFIDRYGYPRAFGYIDIAESLKEKDPLKNQLAILENIIDSEEKKIANIKGLILPVLATQKEIEEFIQKTYDIFEFVKESEPPTSDFVENYKNVGIAKKVEKLSGELIDYIYIPALLLELDESVEKKGAMKKIEDFKWKLLLPFNNDPKEPWNKFVNMIFNPYSLRNIVNEIQKFK